MGKKGVTYSDLNHSKGRHSCESRNPGKHWIPPCQARGGLRQARNDKLHKTYVVMYISLVFFLLIILFATVGTSNAQPKISNFEMSPKEIGYNTEVTISFDYENVEGGLKEAKVFLTQKIQLPGEEKVVTRTSNWQSYLTDLSNYPSASGRFEKKFINADLWRGPQIKLTYEIKVIDKNGKESNICTTTITPK
ncbi:MAG: hypothetical protein HXY44_18975 [Syntrophaceae bacterium]|nr:hypothetical protein [Syntrophaceae bacterium]